MKFPCQNRQQAIDYLNSLTINEENPWVMQEFISGREYCTHGTCFNGQLTLYTCCHSSAWQLNYKHIDNPEILQWCTKYVRELNLTGHPSFDFIISDDNKKPFGIECNPRVHSAITAFYKNT